MIFNHYAATLSALDKLIVNSVPPGGNWKNIPETVPSHRLVQIRESFKAGKGSVVGSFTTAARSFCGEKCFHGKATQAFRYFPP